MLDWLLHIWTKPLAQWTLLDLIGVGATLIVGGVAIAMSLVVFVGIEGIAGSLSRRFNEYDVRRAQKDGKRMLRKLGYNDSETPEPSTPSVDADKW